MGSRGGRYGKKRGGGGGGRGKRHQKGDQSERAPRSDYVDVPTENAIFEKYYKIRGANRNTRRLKAFSVTRNGSLPWASLKSTLPTSFRITGSKKYASELPRHYGEELFPALQNIEFERKEKLNLPPRYHALRTYPDVAKFHSFLMAETEAGNISRQEAVSMIPPLLLNVEPEHYVLDMCAAPGSKTAQIIEALHQNVTGMPDGLVVANDVDYKRSHMLVHQTSRLESPSLVVTNHEAQFFPSIYFTPKGQDKVDALQFDLENEAVVAEVLKSCQWISCFGRRVSRDARIEEETWYYTWKVMDQEGNMHDSIDTIASQSHKKFPASLFPPENAKDLGLENACALCLSIRTRVPSLLLSSPRWANTGSLDKLAKEGHTAANKPTTDASTAESPKTGSKRASNESEDDATKKTKTEAAVEPSDGDAPGAETPVAGAEVVAKKEVNGWAGKGEQPFLFVNMDHEDIRNFVNFYGIDPKFPRDQFVVRSDVVPFKTLYLVSNAVKKLLLASNSSSLKIVNTGVRMFSRNSGNADAKVKFPYRLAHEGIRTLAPYISEEKIINFTAKDLLVLLNQEYPKFDEFTEEVKKALEASEMGCIAVRFTPTEDTLTSGSLREVSYFPVWRAGVSVSLLVAKKERVGIKSRLTGNIFDTHRSKRLAQGDNSEAIAAEDGGEDVGEEEETEEVDATKMETE
ncbi:hypothetical protein BC829DRAFT_439945 [Chytridium lagenaria]|nr:hypothetical protein BC829DRAFT_439945 [Chytridium lagenaria]